MPDKSSNTAITVLGETSKYRIEKHGDKIVYVNKENNAAVKEKPLYQQYGSPEISKVLEILGDKAIKTKQDFGQFSTQHQGEGIYRSGNNEFDWKDLQARHGDWIANEYTGGFDKFVADLRNPDKATSRIATNWFQDQVNRKATRQFGKDAVYFNEDGSSPYAKDGKFGQVTFSVPRFFDLKEEKEKEEIPVNDVTFDQPESPEGGWWIQDIMALAGAATEQVNKYEPVHQQVDLQTPDYSLLDPSRQVAAIQEQSARFSDLAQNTSEGQVARANVFGESGQAMGQVADVLANYENQNVGIVNANNNQVVAIQNQEELTNTQLDDVYQTRLATMNQQFDNAQRDKKRNVLAAFINGTSNMMKQKQMEQVLFPEIKVDRMNGTVYSNNHVANNEKDLTNPYSSAGSSMTDPAQVRRYQDQIYKTSYETYISRGYAPELATKAAHADSQKALPKGKEFNQALYQQGMNSMQYGIPDFDL